MKPEDYRPKNKEKPERKGKLSTRKRLMLATAQEWKPITSLQLREAYSSKTEWIKKNNSQIETESRSTRRKRRR
jgi:hypothetical protein